MRGILRQNKCVAYEDDWAAPVTRWTRKTSRWGFQGAEMRLRLRKGRQYRSAVWRVWWYVNMRLVREAGWYSKWSMRKWIVSSCFALARNLTMWSEGIFHYKMAIRKYKNIYFGPQRNWHSRNPTTSLLAQHDCPIIVHRNTRKGKLQNTQNRKYKEVNDWNPENERFRLIDNEIWPLRFTIPHLLHCISHSFIQSFFNTTWRATWRDAPSWYLGVFRARYKETRGRRLNLARCCE